MVIQRRNILLLITLCVILLGIGILSERESESCQKKHYSGDETSGGNDPPACNSNIIVCEGNYWCTGGWARGWVCCTEQSTPRTCVEYDAVYDEQTQTCKIGAQLGSYTDGTNTEVITSGPCSTA